MADVQALEAMPDQLPVLRYVVRSSGAPFVMVPLIERIQGFIGIPYFSARVAGLLQQ